jgi:hypothetical protein
LNEPELPSSKEVEDALLAEAVHTRSPVPGEPELLRGPRSLEDVRAYAVELARGRDGPSTHVLWRGAKGYYARRPEELPPEPDAVRVEVVAPPENYEGSAEPLLGPARAAVPDDEVLPPSSGMTPLREP